MAHTARLHVPGGVTHVMLRGNGGRGLFFAESSQRRFPERPEVGVARFRPGPGTLSRAAGRPGRRLAQDPDFARRIEGA